MSNRRTGFLLLLDFDGVICDSAMECLVSSWAAYQSIRGGRDESALPACLKQDFLSMRPFIRTGEDFVLVQDLIDRQIIVRSQKEFDRFAAEKTRDEMDLFRKLFYAARTSLMTSNRDYWLDLNVIYHHMIEPLKELCDRDGLRIISTKRPEFIVEILRAKGIPFPRERVYLSPREGKLALAARLLDESRLDKACLVDDQIDHISGNTRQDMDVNLASWGYVKEEWIRDAPAGVAVIDSEEMLVLFNIFEESG